MRVFVTHKSWIVECIWKSFNQLSKVHKLKTTWKAKLTVTGIWMNCHNKGNILKPKSEIEFIHKFNEGAEPKADFRCHKMSNPPSNQGKWEGTTSYGTHETKTFHCFRTPWTNQNSFVQQVCKHFLSRNKGNFIMISLCDFTTSYYWKNRKYRLVRIGDRNFTSKSQFCTFLIGKL